MIKDKNQEKRERLLKQIIQLKNQEEVPTMLPNAAMSSRAFSTVASAPVRIAPPCAPFSRSSVVRRRVSMSAMVTVLLRTK